MPATWMTNKEKILWISRDKEAGDKCRNAFDILYEWAINPPK